MNENFFLQKQPKAQLFYLFLYENYSFFNITHF